MGSIGDVEVHGAEHKPLSQRESQYVPISKQRVFSFGGLQKGDHLVQQRLFDHHYLVESVSSDGKTCEVFESWRKWFGKKTLKRDEVFNGGEWVYVLNYEPGACIDADSAIEKANELSNGILLDSAYARKRIVTSIKTQKKCKDDVAVSDLPDSCHLSPTSMEQPCPKPISISPVHVDDQINSSLKEGDHVIYNISSEEYCSTYRSGLVLSIDIAGEGINLMTLIGSLNNNAPSGVIKSDVPFCALRNLHKVNYYSTVWLSPEAAVRRANTRLKKQDGTKEHFHSWNNNSHLFVTWCMTGKEHTLTDILRELQDREKENTGKPVLYKQSINSCEDITHGDHLVHNSHHYLVRNTSTNRTTFDAYTIQHTRCVCKTGLKVKKGSYKIEYCDFDTRTPQKSLDIAEENVASRNWISSCRFVTEMKCETDYFIDERCIMEAVDPIGQRETDPANSRTCWPIESRTRISSHITIEPGDHIMIKQKVAEEFHSALVYKCVDEYKFLIIPPLPGKKHCDDVDLSPERLKKEAGEAYRINYSQSLPGSEVLARAWCKSGVAMPQADSQSSWDYVTWAKLGKRKAVERPDLSTLPEADMFMTLDSNVHRCYELVRSPEDIKVGDHIFLKTGPVNVALYHNHMLVTKTTDTITKYEVAYCLRTCIKEEEMDFANSVVYRIRYVNELPSHKAVERAKSKVGKHNFSPWSRLWFVTWAKTGQDSVEVSLLRNRSYPESKSQISSFTQLNRGDYLVKQYTAQHYRHYIVLSVESPTRCTVCESKRRQVRKTDLTWEDRSDVYYRINYEDGVCFEAEHSIKRAEAEIGVCDLTVAPLTSRRRFIHYLKTGEDEQVNVDNLNDDHIFSLELERVTSTADLKIGDHIIRPIGKKVLRTIGATHHMLVESLVDSGDHNNNIMVKVRHYRVPAGGRCRKGKVTSEKVSIRQGGEFYRIPYPDRINPKEGAEALKDANPEQVERYNVLFFNCEHLLTGVITGVAYSSQVESVASRLLKFSRTSIRNHLSKCASHGPRELVVHSGTHHGLAARIAIRLPMIKSAIMTGGITLAINLLLEIPLLVRHLYKLHRRRKFNDISTVELKRHVIREIFECIFILLGSVGGAVLGQILIPVPILGGIVGGVGGVIIGQILGYVLGWLAGRLVRPRKPVTLPTVVRRQHFSY